MKGCARWKEAIAGCAAGKTPEPDLVAHLALCRQCESALQESRAMASRLDEALYRSAAVEPPLYGPERVMARIHSQTAGQTAAQTAGQTDTRAWWRWAVAGTALAAMSIAIAIWVRRPPPEADIAVFSTWRSPTQALLRPPVAAAWTTTPRLGEGFFKIRPPGEIHAQ
jgi:hypothetical protein